MKIASWIKNALHSAKCITFFSQHKRNYAVKNVTNNWKENQRRAGQA
jgi:hypothetical protein